MEIKVEPKQVAVAFLMVVATLTVINSILLSFTFYLDDTELFGLVDFFDVAHEGNIPTLYSAVAIFFCSGLLALITRAQWRKSGGKRAYWLGLAILFLFLGFDEGTAIHEEIGTFLEDYMDARGALYFLWVVPYGLATVVIGLAYLKFVWALPTRTRLHFIMAGVIFLTGVLGIEMLGAREADIYGYDTVIYSFLYSLEEMLEMLGVVVFIYALLSYLAQLQGGLVLVLGERDERNSS